MLVKKYICNIQVCNIIWSFYLVNNKNEELNDNDESYCFGSTNYEKTEVLLLYTLAPTMMYQTIKHELTHVFGMSYGLDLDNFTQENICEFFAAHGEEIINKAKIIKKAVREFKKKEVI